ncbi:MAG: MFS transporter [Porticoccaceae bacterium]
MTDPNPSSAFSEIERRATASLASLYGFRMLGLFMVLPVLALYMDDYGDASPLMLGLTLGAYGLTQALLQIPLGLLSDRIGRWPVIIGGLLLFVVGSIFAATAETMVELIVGRAMQGMGAIASTLMAMVTDLTSEENRTKAMAAIGGSIGLSFVLAMIVGPVIADYAGLSGIFWLTAVLGALGIMVFVTQVPRATVVQRNRETVADITQVGQLLRNPELLRLNLGIFALHLALMAAFVVVPTILTEELGIANKDLWWVYAILLGGGFVVMIPAMIHGERTQKHRLSFLSAIAVLALSMLVLGVQRGALLTPLMLLLFFAAFNLLEASLPSWLSKVCPVGNRGTAMGIYSSCQFFGAFVGGLLGGWSLQYYGINGLFLLISGVLLIWWLLALGLQSPRALQTVVLQVGDRDHQDFAKIVSTITGVEDILLIEGEQLAYIKIDKDRVDMQSLKPYFNRTDN